MASLVLMGLVMMIVLFYSARSLNYWRSSKAVLGTLLLALAWHGSAAPYLPPAGRLPKGELWNLTDTGVDGGIPDSSTMVVYTTFSSGATAAQINTAIQNCPSNQVVQLGPGTYTLDNELDLKSGVVLRGAGPNSTILNFTGGGGFVGGLIEVKGPFVDPPSVVKNWTAGYLQGSTTITLDNVTGLSVGQMVALDQLNDASIGVSPGSDTFISRSSGARCQGQTALITAISGNNVTLSHGIVATNFSAANDPELFLIGRPIMRAGVENLQIRNVNLSIADYNILFMGAWNCWAKNIKSLVAENAHFRMFQASRIEVRHSHFLETKSYASQSYGANVSYYSSWCLVEDNIFQQVTTPVFLWGVAAGNVIAYNMCVSNRYDVSPTWQINSMGMHGAHPTHNLFEGNYSANIEGDYIHGSSSHNTVFRNRLVGNDETLNLVYTFPVILERNNRFWSFVGNVLGKDGLHTRYRLQNTVHSGGDNYIYVLGYNNTSLGSLSGYDTAVPNTVLLKENFNYADDAIPAVESLGSDTLSASWFRSSKPTWWGDRPWPWVNPDSPGTVVPTNLPAGYRYVFGVDPPPGGPVNHPPTPRITGAPVSGDAPLTVQFSSSGSSDPEGAALSFHWVFGDGSTSAQANPSHVFQVNGTYVAYVTVSDGTNSVASTNLTIRVGNQVPEAQVAANPSSGFYPLTVSFSSAGSLDPEGLPLSYLWSFGDGSTSAQPNPSHTYANVGAYVARLTVSDGVNSTTSSDINISVSDPTASLVAAFGFEEGSGTTVSDVGNGNSGSVSGATWSTAGRFGNALQFNGAGAFVAVNPSVALNLTAGITLEAWVRPNTLGGWRPVILKSPLSYVLQGSTGGSSSTPVPSFGGTFSPANLLGATALPLDTWSHLAATYDGNTMRLFVNGVQVSSRPQTGNLQPSAQSLHIGGDPDAGVYWAGLIDEVRIYSRALSAAEIQTDMARPVGSSSAKPSPPSRLRIVSGAP